MALTTPAFRVSYPNVFKPKRNELSNKDEYSLEAVFPKDADLSKLKAAATEAIENKWGKDKNKWPKALRSPFRAQADKIKRDEETGKEFLPDPYVDGATYMNLKSTNKPGVVDEQVQPIIDPSKIYPGCWMRATISAYAYDQAGNRGVNFGLQNLQFVKDGDPLGGRTKPEDDFAPVGMETGSAGAQSATDLFS